MIKMSPKTKEALVFIKPKLVTTGLWLLWLAALVFLATGATLFGEDTVSGTVCFALTLGAIIFLLKRPRKALHFSSLLTLFAFAATLVAVLSQTFRHVDGDDAFTLGFLLFFDFTALNLIGRGKWVRRLGFLLLIVVVLAGLAIVAAPKVWISDLTVGVLVGIATIGIGISLVLRRGIFIRLLGVGAIISSIVAFAFYFLTSFQPIEVKEENKELILGYTASQIEDLIGGWNEENYEKFSADFDPLLREQVTESVFKEVRQSWGECLLKGDAVVYGQGGFDKRVVYIANFAETPFAELIFIFTESDGRWKIIGLSFTPVEQVPAEGSQGVGGNT